MSWQHITYEFIDYVIAWLLALIIVFTIAVFTKLANLPPAHEALGAKYEHRSRYPDIPQCDKELWERITEGCKDE